MAVPEAHPSEAGTTPTVTDTPAGPLIVFGHDDGAVTRFSSGTRFSLRSGWPGAGVVVNLESGSSWHRVGARSAPDAYRLVVTPGSLSMDDAVALLVCQPDGECFVGAVEGQVQVVPRSASPFVVCRDQVAWMAPAGDSCMVFDDFDFDELEDSAWIAANRDLDRRLPARRPTLQVLPASAPVPATPSHGPPVGEPAGVPTTPAAAPPRTRVIAWLLVAAGLAAPVVTALLAAGR